jgi:hypothetical protein
MERQTKDQTLTTDRPQLQTFEQKRPKITSGEPTIDDAFL